MSFDYINEAFKRLNVLDEEMFDSSTDGINKLSEFVKEDDSAEDVITIIDPEAEDEDDLKDSYVGKVITNCNVCHSHIFNDKEDIEIDEDGTVNVDQACPYCGESEGFMIIGEIAPFGQNSVQQSSEEDPALNEALGVGAGLALGGAALGAGHVISSLIDDVNVEESEEVLTEEEAIEDESVNEAVHLGPASVIGSAVADVGSKIADKVFGENIDEDELSETTDDLEEGIFGLGKKKNTATAGKSGKYDAAYAKALEKTPVVVKLWRDKSHKPEIVDYFDSNLAAEGVVRRHQNDVDKSVVYRYMMAKEAQNMGAVVSVPSKFVNKYLSEEMTNFEENCSRATRRAMSEDFKEVAITTDDQHMEMTSDENGKVTVTTEPITSVDSDEEVIAPVSDETTDDIMTNNDIETDVESEEPAEDVDTEFDEVDTDSMDELGESYLRNVYSNVESFKTTSVMANDRKFIVEGIIRFTSGKQKKTGFIFEAKDINTRGQVRFTGTNSQLTESKDAFSLVGKIDNKKLFVESLKYNYKVSNRPVRGIARRK